MVISHSISLLLSERNGKFGLQLMDLRYSKKQIEHRRVLFVFTACFLHIHYRSANPSMLYVSSVSEFNTKFCNVHIYYKVVFVCPFNLPCSEAALTSQNLHQTFCILLHAQQLITCIYLWEQALLTKNDGKFRKVTSCTPWKDAALFS